ncbi:hypothetical protein GGQ26_04185 [Aeromicrobium sp. zg-629]|nr:hypothetical protein [Aeromicrobium senzhongii]
MSPRGGGQPLGSARTQGMSLCEGAREGPVTDGGKPVSASTLERARWRRAAARAVPLVLVAGTLLGTPAQAEPLAPVDGAQTAGDAIFPHVGNGGYDALHYDVDIAWQANGLVGNIMSGELTDASTTMRARTTGAPLRTFSLDFEGLQIDSVTVNGAPATYERVQSAAAIKFKLIVTPAEPVEGEFTTEVTYRGTPSTHVDPDNSWEGWVPTTDGAIFMGQPVGAMAGFPHNNTPGDKATWSFTLDVPSTITSATGTGPAAAVSNGELASKTVSPGGERTTWEWVQREQMASELALISIGKYDVHESQVTLSGGRVIPEWSFVDSSLSEANKTTINNRRALLGEMLRRFEGVFGLYPGNSTGVVIDTVPSGINYALETQDRSFFPSAGSVNGNTLLHELAHQWYGNNVSPGLWTDIWINEGMGTWAPTYYNSVLAAPTPNPGAVETTYYNSWSNTAPASSNWKTPPGAQTNPGNLYGYQTYTRGAQFWEALRTVLRDEDFLRVLKRWQVRYAGTSPRADRLKELAEEISGHDLNAFWQDWIYDADKPAWPSKYDVSVSSEPAQGTVSGGAEVAFTVKAVNSGKVPLPAATVTVDVGDVVDDGRLGTLPAGVTRAGETLTWTVPETAVGATASTTFTVTTRAASDDLFVKADPVTMGGACVACGGLKSAPKPTVSGTPTVGATLTAEGAWPQGTTLTHEWSVDGVVRTGATERTFVPEPTDIGKTVSVVVTGVAPGRSATRRVSAPTEAVVEGMQAATPVPTLSGTPRVDAEVSVVPGEWDAGVSLTREWFVDGESVGNGASYTPTAADAGKPLTVAVTGERAGYASVTRTSAAVEVALAEQSATPVPTIAGTARFGSTLRATAGTWDAGVTLTYQWRRNGAPIAGATTATYRSGLADLGKRISVEVTGSRAGYESVSKVSVATAPVVRATLPRGRVKVVGKPVVGRQLGLSVTRFGSGHRVTYRWYVGGKRVGNAKKLRLKKGYAGKRVSYRVTISKPGFTTVTKSGKVKAKVKPRR